MFLAWFAVTRESGIEYQQDFSLFQKHCISKNPGTY